MSVPMTSYAPSRRSGVPPFRVMDLMRAARLRQQTHGDLLLLCVGQPATPAPRVVIDAVREAVGTETLGYTPAAGSPEVRAAVADHYRRTYGLEVDPGEVVVGCGSSGAFTALLLAAFDPGDRIAMTRPGYPAYRNSIEAVGCEVVDLVADASTGFQPTVAMLDALPVRPDGVLLASPANPTGSVIAADELAGIARWCDEHGVLLISDEIYHGISFGAEVASARALTRNAVVMGSVSKYFSMTGWRLGWMLLPEWLESAVEDLHGNLAICAPAVSQLAAISALAPQARPELDGHVAEYARNRDVVLRRLPELGVRESAPVDGAFYAYCDVGHLTDDSLSWCHRVLEATGVAIAPGVDFDPVDGGRYVRISFCGRTAELEEAFDRLVAYVRP